MLGRAAAGHQLDDRPLVGGAGGHDPSRVAQGQGERGVPYAGGDQRAPVGEHAAAEGQGLGHGGQVEVAVLAERAGEVGGGRVQRGGGVGGEHEEPRPGRRRVGGGADGGRLLHDDVGVGAADAEGAHARPARGRARGPLLGLGADVEGSRREVDLRVGGFEAEARDQGAVAQHQDRLDQARHARGRVEVADVGLDGAQRAGAGGECGALAVEGLVERGDLDRVAERRGRAVGLHVRDGLRADVGDLLGLGDNGGLCPGRSARCNPSCPNRRC
ncbi:hypothetical protein SALBM135S_05855 [Streptomyces alboniger]